MLALNTKIIRNMIETLKNRFNKLGKTYFIHYDSLSTNTCVHQNRKKTKARSHKLTPELIQRVNQQPPNLYSSLPILLPTKLQSNIKYLTVWRVRIEL